MSTQVQLGYRNHPCPLPHHKGSKPSKKMDVDAFRKYVNGILSMDGTPQVAKAYLCTVLENVLHETGNYHGFGYIGWMEGGYQRWKAAGEPEDKEEYRGNEYDRIYY